MIQGSQEDGSVLKSTSGEIFDGDKKVLKEQEVSYRKKKKRFFHAIELFS